MNATVFDTHRIVKRLKEAGFSDDIQAETVTDVLSESRALDLSELATKADLKAEVALIRSDLSDFVTKADLKTALSDFVTKADLKTELAVLRTEISGLKADIFKWIVPLLLGQAAVTATLVKLL